VAPRTVLLVGSFGAFLAFLDATVVNVAFPDIRASFPTTSISGLSWVLNAYNIVFASFLIVFGRLADLVGRRRMFTGGIALFTLASVWCALAGSLDLLVVARIVQAAGAAMLVPASLAVIVEAFPAGRRGHAVSLWGASAAVAAGLGPPIGGALVELGGWRWAFAVNLPIGAAAWWLARRTLVESRAPGSRRMPDLRGAVLLAAALSLLTLGIVQGDTWGWSSLRVIGALAGAAVLAVGFVLSSRAHPQPLLDPALLRIRPFAAGNAVTVVAGMGFYAYMLTNILWLQYVWGYEILRAGLALVPGALVAAVVGARLGPVAQQHGFRRVLVPGALVWAAAYLWYAVVVGPEPSFWAHWLPGQVLSGIGVGATLPVLGSAALAAVPGGRFATASAVVSSTRQLGGVLGIALLVVIIGTPTPLTAATVLRHGWIFCAVCFVVVAAASLLVRVGATSATVEDGDLGDARTQLSVPERLGTPATDVPTDRASYLSRLPDTVRAHLERSGDEVLVLAGHWLFEAGEPAEAMYVVLSGRLEVVTQDTVLRELGAGSILGELALLTGERRSASVRARRDSRLLRVSREDFVAALGTDPQAPMAVARALAEQLQSPHRGDGSSSSQPAVVAVVGLSPTAPVDAVASALTAGLRRHLRVHLTSGVDPDGLARAEHDNDRVVLSAGIDGSGPSPWWQSCLRQSDRAVLVARSDDPPPASWDGPAGAELVLVGPPPPEETLTAWSASVSPWQLVVVDDADLARGLGSLVARLAGRSLGLVLAGGGARAMTHVGVLAELEDAGIEVGRVAGASLGAIVAACWARGWDAAETESVFYEEFVRHNPFGDYTVPVTALSKGRRTAELLRRRLGNSRIETLPRQFRCVSTDLLARTRHVHRAGPLAEAVIASCRLPVLFPPVRADGRLLVDGGVLDNMPVGLLTERDEGPIVAVNIGMSTGGPRPGSGRPLRIPGLGETLMRTMMIGSAGAADQARAAGAFVVTPPALGVGLLEFHQMDRMVQAGRMSARALLEEVDGDLFGSRA
jgi:EmrB/QacA subfamily drug resistance transporter